MTNDFSQIPSESEFRNEMTVTTEEVSEGCPDCGDLDCDGTCCDDPRLYPGEENTHYYPGDGLGTDDLQDHNNNEADDYRNEEPVEYENPEMDTPLGDLYGGE